MTTKNTIDKKAMSSAMDTVMPALDLLENRLDNGCEMIRQDGEWCLFDDDGELVCRGASIRKFLIELIFTDC